MPSYVFDQGMVFPLTFAVKEYSKNFTASFAKLSTKHIFFSMAIQLKRVFYFADPASVNITIKSEFNFYNKFDFEFSENSTFSNLIIEFPKNIFTSPLSLFFIKQGINFTNFDVEFEITSRNFSGILSPRIVCYTMNANTWNFTSLFRLGVFIATCYFLIGFLFCYNDNHDYPLHKELLIMLIVAFFGINIFQRFATREFLWFRYSYLLSTLFYMCYRIYMLKFLFLLKENQFQLCHENILKWTAYIILVLMEVIEICDVQAHSDNIYWLYEPNCKKSMIDYTIIFLNFYFSAFTFYFIVKIYVYSKISTDETKKFFTVVILTFFFISIIFNFYVECFFAFYYHLRKTTSRFFVEYLNAYLVLFALAFIHNTRCFTFPKFD